MKRVRKDVCHVWAHQLQSDARYGNIFFHGDTIYSYGTHFPIARHVKAKNGRPIILFTTQGYSSSTSCHMGQVREAIPPHTLVLHVHDVTVKPNRTQLDEFEGRIATLSLQATRAKTRFESIVDDLRQTVAEANAFCTAFGFNRIFVMPDGLDEMQRVASERAQKLKRSQAAAERTAKRKRAKQLADDLAKIEEWKAGNADYAPRIDGQSFLRLSKDGQNVETSRHAIIPLKHVKRVAKLILKKSVAGTEWHSNGEVIRVGQYQLDSIDMDGAVHVGCHRFERSEIERFAAVLGVK